MKRAECYWPRTLEEELRRRRAAQAIRKDGEPFAKAFARKDDAGDQRARHAGRATAPKGRPVGVSGGD